MPDTPPHPTPHAAPSLQTVADRAGVSAATVSRALHNPEMVAPDTLERVRVAVEQVGYRPNVFASGLMRRSARVLGVVVPDELDHAAAAALRDAEREARRLGCFLLLISASRLAPHAAADAPALDLLDGAVLLDPASDPSAVARTLRAGVPVLGPAAAASDAAALVRRACAAINAAPR